MQNDLIKLSTTGDDFERAFFQLAYNALQDKITNLIPFMVGFQVVSKSDSLTKAVGVFGFKSNSGQVLYIPSFFINGRIKPVDILYSKNTNQFVPLNENFAELFLKDEISGIGAPSNETKEDVQKSISNPNLRNTIWPPRTGRIAYAALKEIEDPIIMEKSAAALLSKKSYQTPPTLLSFIKQADNSVKEAFWEFLKNAEFADAVRTFYPDQDIADALTVPPIIKTAKPKKLQVFDFDEVPSHLPSKNKSEVATRGYTILDRRPHEDISELGIFKFKETFTNPTQSGFYPYITEMGTIRHGLIITNTEHLIAGYDCNKVIVIDLDAERKGQAYETSGNKVFIKDQITVKDLGSVINGLEDLAESLPNYDEYILINENLKATEPFRIIENYKDASGIRRVKVEPSWFNEAKERINSGEPGKCCDNYATLILTKKVGDKLEKRNKAVYVPKGYKLLKLNFSTSYYPSLDYSLPKNELDAKKKEVEEEKNRIRQGKPGCFSDLAGMLRDNNAFPLTIHTNGSDYFLNIAGAKATYNNAVEAKIAMVTEIGLMEKAAEEVVDSLVPNIKKEGYIKLAVTGEHIFNLQDEQPENNEFGQPTYYGVPFVDQYDGSDGYTKDPTEMGLGVKPDTNEVNKNVNQAVSLAQSGQKEIFDTQAIASLSKYTSSQDKITEYVPSMVSTLDKLGRMLFLAYWDTDTFEETFGKSELPELIELVKNVFNNLGDLVIFLRRAMPGISINDNDQSKNL